MEPMNPRSIKGGVRATPRGQTHEPLQRFGGGEGAWSPVQFSLWSPTCGQVGGTLPSPRRGHGHVHFTSQWEPPGPLPLSEMALPVTYGPEPLDLS